jgi:hypothetical protein
MSVARVNIQKARKAWTCNKCNRVIPVGQERRTWAVGFRGAKQNRCMDCPAPQMSELESSMVSDVYAAIEGVDFDSAGRIEDLQAMIDDVIAAIDEVASDYESNEMFDKNYDLQERAEILQSASSELYGWADSLSEDDSEGPFQTWLDEARQAAKDAVDNLELP